MDLSSTFRITSPGRKAGAKCGRAHHGRENDGDHFAIAARADRHAHAVILAALIFAQKRVLARIEEAGVRIEDAQHSRDRAFVQGVIGVHGDGVILLHDGKDLREIAHGVLKVVGPGCGRFDRRAIDAAKNGGEN